jgi:hypothetical protein
MSNRSRTRPEEGHPRERGETVDTAALEAAAERLTGSNPVAPTVHITKQP